MKVKKKWKRCMHQIALACLLICCIATYVPYKVYAFNFTGTSGCLTWKYTENYDGGYSDVKMTFSKPVYIFKVVGHYPSGESYTTFYFISKQTFTCTVARENHNDDGSIKETTSTLATQGMDARPGWSGTLGYASIMQNNNMHDISGYFDCDGDNLPKRYNVTAGIIAYLGDYIYTLLSDEDASNITGYVTGDDSEGGVNNPIEDDEEIGIPIITKRRYTTVYHDTDMGNASDGKEDIDDSQFIFDWSNKTSTGFNLKKNKYHMTRIQIKVQSKCVVYSGFSHKTVKKRFDNYGEMSSEIKSALVDDTPYSIEYGTVKSMLPKTFSEKHNPLYVGRNFTFYFRVMCNESASGTGKWHCGAWRAVGLNASTTQDQTDDSSNGHIDSDGNYTKDPDDGHNNSDSDSSTVDDKDDAKDQFKDDQKNDVTNGKNDSSGFKWSDLKKLVNECKEVPGLIKSIFSFLPDWVLVFVAVGFGIWIFVLIKRAIV